MFLFHLYKWIFSPIISALGFRCRFYPSCSDYAEAAVREHGWFKGGALSLLRVLKCGPWNEGGIDFVRSPKNSLPGHISRSYSISPNLLPLRFLREYSIAFGSAQRRGSPLADFVYYIPAVKISSARPPLRHVRSRKFEDKDFVARPSHEFFRGQKLVLKRRCLNEAGL